MISSVDRRSEYVENRAGANVRLNNFLTPYTLDDKSSILNAPCGYSNGVYASLRPVQTFGPELITNGGFDTDSDWTKGTGWSIANGKASRTAQSGSTACDQSISLIAGKKYKIVYTLTISAGSFNVRFSGTTNVNGLSRTTSGTYVDYLVAATGNNTFRLVGADGSFVGSIDNVSVKEATDADFDFTRGSAATRVTKDGLIKNVQILSDDLVQNGDFEQIGSEEITNGDFSQIGSELVVNGDFSDSSWWGLDPVWSISNGSANCNGSGVIYKGGVLTIGKSYKVEVEISSYTSGTLTYPNASYTLPSAVGSYTFYYKANSQTVSFTGTNFIGSIDNVSVKEVGQDWTINDGFTVGDNKVICDGSQTSSTSVYQNIGSQSGKIIKFSFNVSNYVSGTLQTAVFGAVGTQSYLVTSNGDFTFYINVQSGHNGNTGFIAQTGFEGDITNISVKEVGQNWTFGGEAIIDNGLVSFVSASNTYSYIRQDISSLSASLYRISVEVKNYVSGAVQVGFSGSSPNLQNLNVSANGVYTVELSPNANGDDLEVSREFGGGAFDFDIDNVSVIEVTDDTDLPRIDYTNGTGSLLLEPQRTNSAVNSEFLDGISAPLIIQGSGFSILNNSENSPEGLTNAMKWTEGTNNGTHWGGLVLTGALVGQPVSVSIFAKRGTSNDRDLVINIYDGSTSDRVHFNLSNGTIYNDGTTNLAITSMVDYGNGWYRCIYTRDILSTGFNSVIGMSNNNNESYLGNGTSNIFAYGLQVELNADYATSYIPTEGSTKTRLQDICNNAGSSDLINSTEGVLYAEISALADDETNREITLSDGTTNNYVLIRFNSGGSNRIYTRVDVNTSVEYFELNTSYNITDNNKIAIRYKNSDFATFINGTKVDFQLSGNTFPSNTLNKINFDNGDGGNDFYGNVKSVAVFKEALTDEELAKITSTTQQEAFYEMRDKMLQINADYYEFGDYTTRLKKLF